MLSKLGGSGEMDLMRHAESEGLAELLDGRLVLSKVAAMAFVGLHPEVVAMVRLLGGGAPVTAAGP